MKMQRRIGRQGFALALLVGSLLAGVATLACSGNRRMSVGGAFHVDSSGRWGHSISVGIHSHGRGR